MTNRDTFAERAVAISTSESPDMAALGLSDEHLRDAMAEIARHLLALGARLVYGGDLRARGFSELLFELVARHRGDADQGDDRADVINYLAWPAHIRMTTAELERAAADLAGAAELVLLALDGTRCPLVERLGMAQREPTDEEWAAGLTAMRLVMRGATQARVVLGGRVEQYKGIMPGIAEEALLSLQARQPLFLLGGFGGCARDICETLGLIPPWAASRPAWQGRRELSAFTGSDLNNGLTAVENATLARTPHVDQAVTLILSGLLRLGAAGAQA
jgi:SLOG cluster2